MANRTTQDANDRLLDARVGSLVDASEQYLLALWVGLHKFEEEVRKEMVKQAQQKAKKEEADAA